MILDALILIPARPASRYPGGAGCPGSCLPTAEHGPGAPAAAGELAHRRAGAPGWGLGPNLPAPAAAAPAPPPPSLPSFLPSPPPFTFPEARGDGGRGAGRGLSRRLLLVGCRGSRSQPPGGAAPGDPGVRASGRRRCCSGPGSGACPATGSAARRRLPGIPCAAGASLAPPLGSSPQPE